MGDVGLVSDCDFCVFGVCRRCLMIVCWRLWLVSMGVTVWVGMGGVCLVSVGDVWWLCDCVLVSMGGDVSVWCQWCLEGLTGSEEIIQSWNRSRMVPCVPQPGCIYYLPLSVLQHVVQLPASIPPRAPYSASGPYLVSMDLELNPRVNLLHLPLNISLPRFTSVYLSLFFSLWFSLHLSYVYLSISRPLILFLSLYLFALPLCTSLSLSLCLCLYWPWWLQRGLRTVVSSPWEIYYPAAPVTQKNTSVDQIYSSSDTQWTK